MPGPLGANFTAPTQPSPGSAPGANTATSPGTHDAAGGFNMFGNSASPGYLGTGQYNAPAYAINSAAFQNPTGNQGANWNNAMAGMLGQTTGSAPQLAAAQQANGPNLGQYNQTYGQLQGLANTYAQQAAGNGPSLAATTAAQQANQNYAQQLGMLGANGGNPAMAKYQAGQALGATQAGASQQAVMGRTQEEMNAMAQQGNVLGGLQGNALGAAGMGVQAGQFNAGQANQFALAQGQLQAGQNSLNAQQYNQYVQNLGQVNSQQLSANIAQQQLGVQQQMSLDQINAQAYQNAAKNNGSLFSGAGSSVGALAALA